ncbi:ATP-binding protein [Rhizobium sp. BK251]|uniref:ATP-binding protein n=1 Tax=Rhizobium sp. BK251 TaxID=2512125 RepID=UPI00105286B9|nr:ATP-binding protein [Rhizobium sp. BK251]TCL75680.1 PAS/PAC sensor signal transduction histidine kinase [Rhizobium sp. BK251]
MPAIQYPFIDIAVHDRVRDRFARGEAMALFSADMARVLWANGGGAELFGRDSIYDFLDQGARRSDVSFRQVETAAQQLAEIGDSRNFIIRVTSGFRQLPVQALAELISIQQGERAVLFSAPFSGRPLTLEKRAAKMLEGFDDPDTHTAVVGEEGEILAASARFAALGVTQHTAKTLVTMAGAHPDRLVKRPIPTGKGYLPAAVGKLSEEPALNLFFVVETIIGHLDPVENFAGEVKAAEEKPTPAAPQDFAGVIDAVAGIEDVEDDIEAVAEETADDTDDVAATESHGTVSDDGDADASAEDEAHSEDAQPVALPEEVERVEPTQPTEPTPDAEPAKSAAEAVPHTIEKPQRTDTEGFVFQPQGRATRFVWKIDAEGRFSEVSHEFAEAVGPRAADVIGLDFADVARRFNLDPDGRIAELLARRDTWSGKTIYWPVEGTELVVPVDLAALPTYTRSREFDGFRGFGVVRIADAAEDSRKLGLTLGASAPEAAPDQSEAAREATAPEAASEKPPAEDASPSDSFVAEPPAISISESRNRRLPDKVVRLHGRRTTIGEGLSASEQAAFREIARQLQPLGTQDAEPEAEVASADTDTVDAAPAAGAAQSQAESVPEADAAAVDQAPASSAEDPVETEQVAQQDATPEETVAEAAEAVSPRDALNSYIPPRAKMRDGLTADVIDQMPVAILVHAGDELIYGNAEFLRLTGYETLEALAEIGGIDALLQRQDLEGKTERPGSMMLVTSDDTLVPVTARLQSIRWENASALLLALMPVETAVAEPDVAETQPEAHDEGRSERMVGKVAKLQVEVEELQSILETATDGVVVIGAEGDIRSMNRSASALFNYDEGETRGKPFVMLFAHESQKAVLDYLGGLSGHGVASVLNDGREVIGREASGGFVPLFMTMGRLNSSSGYCAVIRDITQWKRTEDELRNAKRSAETANAHKTDFLARVSHEIRTPLNAIIGFSDIMSSERFGPIGHPRYIEYANDIGRSGRHVLDIVNDLLDISKIEAGEMDLEFSAVGLNEAISEAVSLVQPQANAQRVIIRTALSQAVPNIVGDLRSIKQIALNILSNAIRFTPSGGQIVVSTSYEANGSVVLRVRDTGIGMTRTELEQALKPFRQVSTNSRNRGDGTGLGLPLTKAMVDANRAIFSISSAPNEGTLVEVTFPSPRVLAN